MSGGKLPGGSDTPSTEKTLWRTPPALALAIFGAYGAPDLDAAATDGSVSLGGNGWLSPAEDGLDPRPWWERRRKASEWLPLTDRPVAWLNPPCGGGRTGTGAWSRRALCELPRLHQLYMLVPECTDTNWWWSLASYPGALVLSLGRVAYNRPDGTPGQIPPQGSSLFLLRPCPVGAECAAVTLHRWRWQTEPPPPLSTLSKKDIQP